MLAPVLVTPAASMPVSLEEAKLHLKVEGAEEDALIEGLIAAAVGHLDGPTGVLGRALVEQTWRQDYDGFGCDMRLRPGPVIEIVSITWRDVGGQISTVADSNYALVTDALGARVYWDASYSSPSNLYKQGAVSVTFKSGYAEVPAALKAAILLMVGNWYRFRSADGETGAAALPHGVEYLISPFMRWGG